MFFKAGVLKNFAIFTAFNIANIVVFTVAAYNFTKKRLQHSCFPVNIAKLLRTALFI